MRTVNLSAVTEAGEFNGLKAGGYICKITNVDDLVDKEYLYIEYDIAEGEHKDYYKKLHESKGFWGGSYRRSYKEKALPFFKRMCSAVTKSNAGYIFDGGEQNADEKTLIGKLIGLVLGEEEYVKNNGEIGTRFVVDREIEIEKIRKGEFKVPEKKYLPNSAPATSNGFVSVPDGVEEELPF